MNTSEKNSTGYTIRFNKPERLQRQFTDSCLDDLIDEDHQVRTVWSYICGLDLTDFYAQYKAVAGNAGRKAADPRILLTLWLMATLEGITSGRHLAKLCKRDSVYRWICGGVGVNYNMLNTFRVNHIEALEGIMVQTIASLKNQGLVDFRRVSQDGIRVRAHAGKASFEKAPKLEELLKEAEEAVNKTLNGDDDDQETTKQQAAAKKHAAEDRARRIEAALEQFDELAEKREKRKKGDGETTRTSTTDPDARNMKMADGGFRPAINIQAATLNDSRLVIGIHATNEGTDSNQMMPMLDSIETKYGERPKEAVVDGGFNSREDVTAVERSGTKVYAPVRASRKKGVDNYAPKPGDTQEVIDWHQRMSTEEAKEIYKERSSVAEFPFMRFRNNGLKQLPVRGLKKAKGIGLLHALASNLQQIVHLGWLSALIPQPKTT